MNVQEIFTSSKLFAIAIGLVVTTGLTLLFVLSRFEDARIVETNIQSTYEEPQVSEHVLTDKDDLSSQPEEANTEPNETPTRSTTSSNVTTLNCTDCTYAAVDKMHALPSTYVPNIVATGLAGGGSLTPSATSSLKAMFAAAQKNGTPLEIISSYRSYQTQADTFAYWVSTERAKGLSQAEAEAEANTYSARPGQSEHQLGTTVDLKCVGCEAFNASQNSAAYEFIENNAHKYGFAISYPKGQDALTGYTYEPWHIRWIGNDLAAELFSTGYTAGNGNYLAQFLRNKNL